MAQKILTLIFLVFSIFFAVLIILNLKLIYDYKMMCNDICGEYEVVSCEESKIVCFQKEEKIYRIYTFKGTE